MSKIKTMRQLKEYISLPAITIRYRNKYTNGKCPILEQNIEDSSFEKFILSNNIENIDDDLYDFYVSENFKEDDGRSYSFYQHKLYESILYSYSAKELMSKIIEANPNVNISNIQYVNNNKVTQFSFSVSKKDDLDAVFTNKVISLLSLYNYYVKLRTIDIDENDKECYSITIEPYKPKDITDKIYNDCGGIVYHITDRNTYIDNIKNKELKPKGKYNDEYRDKRIFFIADRNEKEIKRQLRSIFNTSIKIKHPIVLKIDLNKYKNRLRFRIDSSAFGYNAYFTEEPIPDYCITCLDLDTWVNIDKKNI